MKTSRLAPALILIGMVGFFAAPSRAFAEPPSASADASLTPEHLDKVLDHARGLDAERGKAGATPRVERIREAIVDLATRVGPSRPDAWESSTPDAILHLAVERANRVIVRGAPSYENTKQALKVLAWGKGAAGLPEDQRRLYVRYETNMDFAKHLEVTRKIEEATDRYLAKLFIAKPTPRAPRTSKPQVPQVLIVDQSNRSKTFVDQSNRSQNFVDNRRRVTLHSTAVRNTNVHKTTNVQNTTNQNRTLIRQGRAIHSPPKPAPPPSVKVKVTVSPQR